MPPSLKYTGFSFSVLFLKEKYQKNFKLWVYLLTKFT